MNSAAGAPVTARACQSDPRCSQHPATGASPDPADPQDSTDPSGCRSTAHRVGEPAGRVGAGCQCSPSAEVHRAGPRRAAAPSSPPVPARGTAPDRHPPPWRSQARGCRVTDCPTATRSPDASAATARIASPPAGSATSCPVAATPGRVAVEPPVTTGGGGDPAGGRSEPRPASATIPTTTAATTATTTAAVSTPRPQYPEPAAPVRTTTGSSRSVTPRPGMLPPGGPLAVG